MYVAYVGKLFLRMLKALILPLIIPSLVAAVGSLDMSLSGKVGLAPEQEHSIAVSKLFCVLPLGP